MKTFPTEEFVELFISLNYTKSFESFDDFYGTNKPEIYKSIINIFEEFQKTDTKVLSLGFSASIHGHQWGTHITLEREQYFILKRDVLPYFEQIEDYETCQRIVKLHNKLVSR